MTLAGTIAAELNNAGIADLGRAYAFYIPASSLVEKKTLIAVSEVMQVPTEHGSNVYNQLVKQIQVKICYPSNTVDADAFEKSITSFFIRQKWQRNSDSGHYVDDQNRIEIDLFFTRRD
ncbi:DUF806 family protein [Lactobacillus sp. ESL0230]|uniref:DUF806 family protein n=1 Tax=Lactobacillus sp. ESL0230 TaxID=2069353 RepID=UPI000EFB18D8|nr:DUF806 family protein [Lactobacillus sp. ESL0230]RMC46515.1 DUF806 family protein [Lactobacillus sp. ESL0230]